MDDLSLNERLLDLFYGAIGGGTISVALRIFENHFVNPRFSESLEGRKKLRKYGKPIWKSSKELRKRLAYMAKKMHRPRASLAALPTDAKSLQWFTTKEGNYITSTAYMIARISCWIILFEQDTVFLKFRRRSSTTQFLCMIQEFKASITKDTILWPNYLDGIGEQLVEYETKEPMSYSKFCINLLEESQFIGYYTQLFVFLNTINQGHFQDSVNNTVSVLQSIENFLILNNIAQVDKVPLNR